MKDFIFTLLAWLFTFPVIAGSIAFAIYNPESHPVIINPFRDAVNMPVYVPVLFAVGFGFFFGAIMTWAATGRLRSKCRAQQKQMKALEKKNSEQVRPTHNYALIPSAFKENK